MAVDNTAKLWDAETGGLERAFLHSSWITTAAFSADSRKVVTACEDGGARVWSVESAALLTEVKQRAHTTSAELSPDGLRLVTSCADGTTRVWDSRTGLPIAEAFRHRNSFHKSRFSAIGERVIIEPNSTLFLISARWKPPPMDLVHARWVWELPAAPPFIPPWLPALAEAVAGQRLNPHGHLEPVPMSELQELHQELAASSHTDYYTRWAKWFFADREARSCSPFSSVMVPEYIRRNLEEGSDRSLREVLRLAPNHALAMARLARRVWAQKPEGNAHRKTEADLLSRRAVQLSSDDPEVVKIRRDIAQGIASLSKP